MNWTAKIVIPQVRPVPAALNQDVGQAMPSDWDAVFRIIHCGPGGRRRRVVGLNNPAARARIRSLARVYFRLKVQFRLLFQSRVDDQLVKNKSRFMSVLT